MTIMNYVINNKYSFKILGAFKLFFNENEEPVSYTTPLTYRILNGFILIVNLILISILGGLNIFGDLLTE